MKKIFTLKCILCFYLFLLSDYLKAQDYITFPNGTFVKVRIIDLNASEIKYNLFNGNNEQLYSVSRNQVYNVRYENGMIDFLNGNTVLPISTANLTNVQTFKTPQIAAATTSTTTTKKSSAPVSKSTVPATASTATNTATAVPADLSKQLNLTPEQLQIIKNMLDANAAAATAQQSATPSAVQSVTPVVVQPTTPIQAQAYNPAMASGVTGAATTNHNSQLASSLLGKKTTNGTVGNTGKLKRPTAFRDYGGLLNINGVIESYADYYDENASAFLGFNFLLEKKIGKSDFGLGLDASILSTYYQLSKYDLPTEDATSYSDFGVRFSYHLPIATFIDPYVSVRGFYYEDEAYEDSDFDTDLIVGTRLMYKNFGLVYEYHFNYEYSMFGISFSFQ